VLPSLPPYEALHPLVVHIPIGVLFVAWMPMVIGLLDSKRRHTWWACGGGLLAVGTIACVLAAMTGESAAGIVGSPTQVISDAIEYHEERAERARNLFIATTLVYLAVWFAYAKIKNSRKGMVLIFGSALVVITYAAAMIELVNTGHSGGVLVHRHGVFAPIVE